MEYHNLIDISGSYSVHIAYLYLCYLSQLHLHHRSLYSLQPKHPRPMRIPRPRNRYTRLPDHIWMVEMKLESVALVL
jgi:hypothetical protein